MSNHPANVTAAALSIARRTANLDRRLVALSTEQVPEARRLVAAALNAGDGKTDLALLGLVESETRRLADAADAIAIMAAGLNNEIALLTRLADGLSTRVTAPT